MDTWIEGIKAKSLKDSWYIKRYGHLIMYNMFQELEYIRLMFFSKEIDYLGEIKKVIDLYSFKDETVRLINLPKYNARLQEYLRIDGSVLGKPRPMFGMEVFYDGKSCSEVRQVLDKFLKLEMELLD